MGGPNPRGGETESIRDHDPVAETQAGPATAPVATGPGATKVAKLLQARAPSKEKIAEVLALYPAEKDQILTMLHTDRRIGNAKADYIVKLAADRFVLGDYGQDPDDTAYLRDAHVATGDGSVADVKTTANEGVVLGAVRASQRRFKASFLFALQRQLGVADASGAFNTETLRKLLAQPQLGGVKDLATAKTDTKAHEAAALILHDDGGWLEALVPKEAQAAAVAAEVASAGKDAPAGPKPAFAAFADTRVAWNATTPEGQRLSPTNVDLANGHRADRVAKALGYATYAEYQTSWQPVAFLGGAFSGKVHPAVNERLAVAERWLRQRHSGKTDEQIRRELQWSGTGNGSYADNAAWVGVNEGGPSVVPGVHMHSFGLAIDIDASRNPYVFGGSANNAYSNHNMDAHLRRAAQLYGGEALTAAKLDDWSQSMSSEELFARVDKANVAFKQYLAEPKKIEVSADLKLRAATKAESKIDVVNGTRKDSAERAAYKAEMHAKQDSADAVRIPVLAAKLAAIGYAPEEAHRAASDWLDFTLDFHGKLDGAIWDAMGRSSSDRLTTHTQDLVIALRDVAGLMWGGSAR